MTSALQSGLDRYGYAAVRRGETTISETLVIGPGKTLVGVGRATVIRWTGGPNEPAIVVNAPTMYDTLLADFVLLEGRLQFARLGPTLRVRNVTVTRSPDHGVVVSGIGDSTVFDGLTIREAAGAGLRVLCTSRMNGLTFRGLSIDGCQQDGVQLHTIGPVAGLHRLAIRDSVIQGNCRTPSFATAELRCVGAVTDLILDHTHIERNPLPGNGIVGQANDDGRRPRGLYLVNGSTIAPKNVTHAIDWRNAEGRVYADASTTIDKPVMEANDGKA